MARARTSARMREAERGMATVASDAIRDIERRRHDEQFLAELRQAAPEADVGAAVERAIQLESTKFL